MNNIQVNIRITQNQATQILAALTHSNRPIGDRAEKIWATVIQARDKAMIEGDAVMSITLPRRDMTLIQMNLQSLSRDQETKHLVAYISTEKFLASRNATEEARKLNAASIADFQSKYN